MPQIRPTIRPRLRRVSRRRRSIARGDTCPAYGTPTRELILTMEVLYQLSYVGLAHRILPPRGSDAPAAGRRSNIYGHPAAPPAACKLLLQNGRNTCQVEL